MGDLRFARGWLVSCVNSWGCLSAEKSQFDSDVCATGDMCRGDLPLAWRRWHSHRPGVPFPATTATVDVLPNGLTLILDPDDAAPVVSAQVWVETGSVHEDEWLGAGLSHLLEHMVFKGTNRYSGEELANTVQAAGGHWNAYTTFDRTVYYIDGPADGLTTFVDVLGEMVFRATLPADDFNKEKEIIHREIDMGLDDPDDVSSRQMFATVYQKDARRQPVIGHRPLFDQVDHEAMLDYYRRRYTVCNAFFVISGDFDPVAIRELIVKATEDLGPVLDPPPVQPVEPAQLGPRSVRATFAVPASKISLCWHTPGLADAGSAARDVLAAILGRGRSSRLYRRLREENQLALEIGAWAWNDRQAPGLFGISAVAEPAQRDALIEAIHAELASLPNSPLDDEIMKAKRQINTAQYHTLTTASGRASDLGSNWHEARDLDFTRRYTLAVDAVTSADVRRVAAELTPDRVTLSILDPLDAPAPAFAASHSRRRPEPEIVTLENGMTVALLPDPRVPLVSLQSASRAGLPSESPASAGLNVLLASVLPKGTTQHGAAELALMLESLGAGLGASSGNNAFQVQASAQSDDLRTILPLFAEVMREPSLGGDVIDRERASQLARLREALEDPLTRGFRTLRQKLFGGAAYGIDSLGDEESLASLNRLALFAHHSRHVVGQNTVVAIAGGFDPGEVRDSLAGTLGLLPAGTPWIPDATALTPGGIHEVAIDKKQAVLAIGYPGLAATDDTRFALQLLHEYCADMAGPLFVRIREELGLAYQVSATQFLGFDTGMMAFFLATSPEQLDLAQDELLAQLDLIADGGIPDAAFERARATLLASVALAQQSPSSIARAAAIDGLIGLGPLHHREVAGRIRALKPDDVRAAAHKLLRGHEATIVRVVPA